jgi:acyl-[acyl-carrier-protein]-phospholipid O-acyltransferase/long-chain-fatty-acid--[acyl-carrier-protein] ligase
LGAFGIALTSSLLFWVQGTIIDPASEWTAGFIYACGLLFILGSSAGLFSVPLEAYMQHRSPRKCRGAILAATNFLVFSGVLISAFTYMGMRYPIHEGSTTQISAELLGPPLAPDAKDQLDELVKEFARRWSQGNDPSIESELAALDASMQSRALSELLWVELQAKRSRDIYVARDEYFERFPNQQLLVKAVYDQAGGRPLLNARQVFLIAGVFTVPVFVYIVWLIPQASIRFLVWLASRTVYRVKVYGRDNLPEQGGALLVSNHVSWIDGVLLLLTSSRPIRMVVWSGNFRSGLMLRLADLWGAILISARPKQIVRALKTARDALNNGELVCIFPEGGITRSGQLLAFRPGMLKILDGAQAPVLPVYLDGLWGSIFSFDRGRFFWKWPRRWPFPIHIYFGQPIQNPGDVNRVRRVVQEMGARAVQSRTEQSAQVVQNFISICRRRRRASKVADSTGAELSGGELLLRTLVVRRLLRQHVLQDDEQYVGVLLPPSTGGVVVNAALAVDRRVSVNLNYTVSNEVLNACIEHASVRHVLTSRRFMEKMEFDLNAEVVYLEDLREKTSTVDKLVAGFQAYVTPTNILARQLNAHKTKGDDVITVIFTSGSTGLPKGVMLTHANVASNVEAVDQVVNLNSRDVLIGVLPFFHSFGYTITMWAVMGIDVKGIYHFNPLDAKIVGKICQKHGGTLLLATPTFLRSYTRRCSKEQFETLEVVVTGAERLPPDVADAFEEKFGVRPVEGYGTTELSPLVSVNVPPARSSGEFQIDRKEGTVGRPIPGVAAKITDLDSGKELSTGQAGMLWITGPNVMRGYLGREDLTNEVVKEGWYMTGDVALVDEDGFIQITGRESRFSKIGGEMVPHIKIEEELSRLVGDDESGGLRAVVTAVPDARKGERLVVVHTAMKASPDELCKSLAEAGLPNLFIPSADSFFEIETLPMLGSGKLDLKGIKKIALERTGVE